MDVPSTHVAQARLRESFNFCINPFASRVSALQKMKHTRLGPRRLTPLIDQSQPFPGHTPHRAPRSARGDRRTGLSAALGVRGEPLLKKYFSSSRYLSSSPTTFVNLSGCILTTQQDSTHSTGVYFSKNRRIKPVPPNRGGFFPMNCS